jgi:outer membrane lipoprotein carrier protein
MTSNEPSASPAPSHLSSACAGRGQPHQLARRAGRRAWLGTVAVSLALALGVASPELGLLAPREAAAAGPTADEVAKKVQTFYDGLKTFQAKFTQTYTIKAQNTQKVSKGTVSFEKPGKMSFRYDEPNGNRVVSDGTTIRVYEKENAQMFEVPVKKSQYPAALAFLMGTGQLTKDFTFTLRDAKEMKFENGYVLDGTPKETSPAYQRVLLYVDSGTNQVRRVLILDAQGNRNRFDFDGPTVNKALAKDEFDFKAPAGTKVVKQ